MTDRSLLSPVARPSGSLAWLPAAAAAALSLALYAVTLHGTYIFDDRAIILEDPRIANPRLWHQYWTDEYFPDAPDNLYRPLASMSYAIQWRLHGDRAWAFHLVNWLLAAAAAGAVAEFARRSVAWGLLAGFRAPPGAMGTLAHGTHSTSCDDPDSLASISDGPAREPADASRRGVWAGLVAGLLFAAHPVHVEVVAEIVGRAELLCTLATFAGLCLFLRRPLTGWRATGIVLCFFIALLSKEQGMLFPLMLAILAWARTPRRAVSPGERACNRWLAVGLIWFETAYFLFREHILKFEWNRQWISWANNPLLRSTGADRWLMPLVLMGHYLAVLVAPYKLSLDYGGGVIGSAVRYHEPYLYLGIAAVAGWMAAFFFAFRLRRRGGRRSPVAGLAAFALLGTALTLGMVSNLPALIGTVFGERLAFMPSAYLAVLAGLVVGAIAPGARRWVVAGIVALAALGSVRTVTYAREWNDAGAFYAASLARQPKSIFLHALVYKKYKDAGNWPAARAIGEHCRREVPQWWESWLMCFEPDIAMGRLKEAHDLIHQAAHVCYNDGLIGWSDKVDQLLARQAATRPSGPATKASK